MPSYTTECPCCERSFKTLYSLSKHVRERHHGEEYPLNPAFKDSDGNVTTLPRPRGNLDPKYQEGYLLWIGRLVERINSTFHPRLPGRWIKVDSHHVPKIYFEYFIGRLNIQVNAVRDVSHKSQPSYQGTTRRISYKMYDLDPFIEALEESNIDLNTEILFSGNKQTICETNSSAGPLSAEEEILRAKHRAYAPLQNNRPSSKSSLVVGYGEGRATREIEIIWWPGLYTYTEHGQLVIRMFLEKILEVTFLWLRTTQFTKLKAIFQITSPKVTNFSVTNYGRHDMATKIVILFVPVNLHLYIQWVCLTLTPNLQGK